jgi:hypothetical protein
VIIYQDGQSVPRHCTLVTCHHDLVERPRIVRGAMAQEYFTLNVPGLLSKVRLAHG